MTRSRLLFGAFLAAYLLLFGWAVLGLYRAFGFYDFDLAVHAQTMYQILHGTLFNSILGLPFLGNHMHPVLFLAAPVYAVFGHPLTLMLLQTAALAFSAIPVYLLAARRLGGSWAVIIGFAYLAYPALAFVNLYEFHPTSFAVFFLAWMLYGYEERRYGLFIACAGLAMLCQENIPLAVLLTGALARIEGRQRRWWMVPVIAAIAYGACAVGLMRYFNAGTIDYGTLYRHLGATPAAIIGNLITHPQVLFGAVFRNAVAFYLVCLLGPLAFLPCLAAVKLLPVSLFFAQHIFSARPSDLSIAYHYTAEMIPFIFFAFIFGLLRLSRIGVVKRHAVVLKTAVAGVSCAAALMLNPAVRIPFSRDIFTPDYRDAYKAKLVRGIPADAPVVATFEFLSHLANRSRLYSLHHQYIGTYTLSVKPYQLPQGITYALIDTNDFLTFRGLYRPDGYRNLISFFDKGSWRAVDMLDELVLLKNDSSAGEPACEKLPADFTVPGGHAPVSTTLGIELAGYETASQAGSDIIDIVFYWRCRKATGVDADVQLDVTDAAGRVLMTKARAVCYRLYPTQSWNEGDIYRERARLYIPAAMRTGNWKLRIAFFNQLNRALIPLEGSDGKNCKQFLEM